MEPSLLEEKKEKKGKISPYWAGRLKQEERDGKIKRYIDEYRVLTVELLMGLLDMPPTLSSRRIVETRLQRLVKLKYIRQIRDGFVTYYVNPLVIKKGNPQYDHKLMESYSWIAFARALVLTEKRTSEMLRGEGGPLIPDGFFTVTTQGFCVENDTGLDDLGALASKAKRYHRDRDYLMRKFDVENVRVLFITKRYKRVAYIIKTIMGIGSGGMFWVTTQEAFQPFDGSIVTPIWRSPKDDQLHALLED